MVCWIFEVIPTLEEKGYVRRSLANSQWKILNWIYESTISYSVLEEEVFENCKGVVPVEVDVGRGGLVGNTHNNDDDIEDDIPLMKKARRMRLALTQNYALQNDIVNILHLALGSLRSLVLQMRTRMVKVN